MKHWQELGQILERVHSLAHVGQPAALAAVTRVSGREPRHLRGRAVAVHA